MGGKKSKSGDKKAGRTAAERAALREGRLKRSKDKRAARAKARKERYYARANKRFRLGLPTPPPTPPRKDSKPLDNLTYMKALRRSILHGIGTRDFYRDRA